jgi:hypothetical protein
MRKPRIYLDTSVIGGCLDSEPSTKAIEMVRSIREGHYDRIKDLSPQEKIAFFRNKARTLHAELGRPEDRLAMPATKVRTDG